jgi:hypothetical protein
MSACGRVLRQTSQPRPRRDDAHKSACDPFSSESWPYLSDIEACRNVNGTRHKFAIHDVGGSGNPVLRRGGDDAVRVSGRKATEGDDPLHGLFLSVGSGRSSQSHHMTSHPSVIRASRPWRPPAHACPPSRHGLPKPRVTGASGAVRAHARVSAWRLR